MTKSETTMKQIGILVLAVFIFSPVAATAASADKPGCKDPVLFPTRMPGYVIESCKGEPFGAYEFQAVKGPKNREEGKTTLTVYAFTGDRTSEPSGLAVVRNYENAIHAIGGETVQSDPERWTNGKLLKDGREFWFEAQKGNGKIWVRTVEKQPMAQAVVADAAAMNNDIRSTGHAAVYGIYFDTAKSTIKPESAQAIAEIAKLLQTDPALKLFVVGHTDNQGGLDTNLKLSQERGEAVLQALVRDQGVAATRLRSYGCGLFAPVASNDSEDGRAKNRRVELVKQ